MEVGLSIIGLLSKPSEQRRSVPTHHRVNNHIILFTCS